LLGLLKKLKRKEIMPNNSTISKALTLTLAWRASASCCSRDFD
jgi:hypothetical protein